MLDCLRLYHCSITINGALTKLSEDISDRNRCQTHGIAASTSERDGVLRGGIKQRVHNSHLVDFVSMSVGAALPSLQMFPPDETEALCIAQTASASQQKHVLDNDPKVTGLA